MSTLNGIFSVGGVCGDLKKHGCKEERTRVVWRRDKEVQAATRWPGSSGKCGKHLGTAIRDSGPEPEPVARQRTSESQKG